MKTAKYRQDSFKSGNSCNYVLFFQEASERTAGGKEEESAEHIENHLPERNHEGSFPVRNHDPRAFRNKYEPGGNEHQIVRKMRSHPDYLPEFSRVAAVWDQIVGLIMYFKAKTVTSVPEPREKENGCGCGLEAVMIRPENRGGMGS